MRIQICDDERWSCGLWSEQDGSFVWLEPMFQFDDLQRLSPAPHVSPTQLTSKRILNSLFEASENTLIKKEEALKIAKGLHDFSRRRFYEAWKKVPIERKFGRGKRGPNRHKA